MTTDPKAWLAVVSAEHVEQAVRLGIVQTNHGKRPGLDRMSPGDWLVYYSAQQRLGEKSPVQAFTAIGRIADGEPWQAEPQGPEGRFRPWRRRVDYRADARWAPLADLRDRLALTADPNWGNRLRRGLLALEGSDLAMIHDAMTGEPLKAAREVPTVQAPLW
jgi:EVE domain